MNDSLKWNLFISVCLSISLMAFTGCDDGDDGGTAGTGGAAGEGGAGGAGGGPQPVSCEEACAAVVGCDLDDAPQTEAECLTVCNEAMEQDPNFARFMSCAVEHLGGGMCDEASFFACSNPAFGFFISMAEIVCAKIFECCPDGNGFIETEEQCQGFIGGFAGAFIQQDIQEGWMAFDETKVEACLSAIRSNISEGDCSTDPFAGGLPSEGQMACDGILTGLQQEGDECGRLSEEGDGASRSNGACTEGLTCGSSDGEEIPVCVPAIADGEACETFGGTDCIDGSACVDGTCAPTLANGEACESDDACASEACIEGACGDEPLMCGGDEPNPG